MKLEKYITTIFLFLITASCSQIPTGNHPTKLMLRDHAGTVQPKKTTKAHITDGEVTWIKVHTYPQEISDEMIQLEGDYLLPVERKRKDLNSIIKEILK
ncbi:hypothetical protein [Halobacteriovorax sp. ZH2_bin.1]|uniref:hypothetical protein n=1 Tax=unclassified Halobacteriovorax TaxID=2639665 RepID=UPI00372199E7